MQAKQTKAETIKRGLILLIPIILGITPFGLIVGMNYIEAGFSIFDAALSSIIIFAGASQIAMLHLITQDTPSFIIVLTVAIVNFRMMLYSASISYYWRALPRKLRLFQAFFLTDQAYAVSLLEYQKNIRTKERIWFYCSFAITMYFFWILSTVLGAVLGTYIPKSFGIDLVLTLVFITVLIPMIKNYHSIISAFFGGITMIFFYDLPNQFGLIVAILAGITSGVLSEYFLPKILKK